MKRFNFNIGTVIFGAIFVYLIASVIIFLTTDHVSSYQVTFGPLGQNETYTALALREEMVVEADSSGYIHTYASDNSKVAKDQVLYSVADDKRQETPKELSREQMALIRAQMERFSNSYNGKNFDDIYRFDYDLGVKLHNFTQEGDPNHTVGTLSVSPKDGVVLYSVDGYERMTEEMLTEKSFEKKNYRAKTLENNDKIQAGDEVCRLVTDEKWSIYLPITAKQYMRLEGTKNIRVKFLKDGNSEMGSLHMIKIGNAYYARIDFFNGMIRYASDRFLEIELVTNIKSGLKLPVSSLVKKEFLEIPADMAVQNEEGTNGFLKEVIDKNGEISTSFIRPEIYLENKEEPEKSVYYVEKTDLAEGDILVKEDESIRYEVKKPVALDGVYCTNKGYAIFRRVELIEKNEEFCIVKTGTTYGLSQYDYVVLNGNSVKEQDIL